MKIYLVGGSVRDKLLNIVPQDTDYLVVDASEKDLIQRGLVKIGQTFPIYLNPENGDEYTLGQSLEEDLRRRDLTINAMALDEKNELIDLFGGESDLRRKILRHVSAENFFEDPLRVLRTARFLSQLPEFSIHPETIKLMREVGSSPQYKNLISERILKELKRVFVSQKPSRFFETLKLIGGFEPFFKEIKVSLAGLDQFKGDEELSFSYLVTGLNLTELEVIAKRLNLQSNWKEKARAWILSQVLSSDSPEGILEYFYQVDVFRKPQILEHVAALNCALGTKLSMLFSELKDIGISDVKPELHGKDIGLEIRRLRLMKLKTIIGNS